MLYWLFTAMLGWLAAPEDVRVVEQVEIIADRGGTAGALELTMASLPEEVRDVDEVEIIAHRGASADAPENTLAAFHLAWERGADAIEADVHLTKDGRLVVIHDADTMRTTGVLMSVKDSTLAELQQLDAGSWKGPEWAGEKLPVLEDVLATIPEGKRCLIEIKVGPESIPATVKAIEASGKTPEQLAIISFKPETIAAAKKALPEIPAYYLASFRQGWYNGEWMPTVEALLELAKEINADAVNVSQKGPIDRDFIELAREAGLGFFVWTVDDATVAKQLLRLGVDGITTNKPHWIEKQLRQD